MSKKLAPASQRAWGSVWALNWEQVVFYFSLLWTVYTGGYILGTPGLHLFSTTDFGLYSS